MAERPILFSGPMVNAILEDRKTVTRRPMVPQPEHLQIHEWKGRVLRDAEARVWCWKQHHGADSWQDITGQLGPFCPYGQPGDELWVREAWRVEYVCDDDPPRDIDPLPVDYQASPDGWMHPGFAGRWRPSIHMPRWACRLRLRVTEARVERLQEILPADCLAEGVQIPVSEKGHPLLQITGKHAPCRYLQNRQEFNPDDWLRAHFASLWDGINAKRAPWESNPWVWVVAFERIEEAAA